MSTISCSGDKKWYRPIRFEILNSLISNALGTYNITCILVYMWVKPAISVICDGFAFCVNNSLGSVVLVWLLSDPSFLTIIIEGCGTQDYYTLNQEYDYLKHFFVSFRY